MYTHFLEWRGMGLSIKHVIKNQIISKASIHSVESVEEGFFVNKCGI